MIHSEELNRLLQLYREQGYPNGVSVEQFAKNYGVSAAVFHNWIRASSQHVVPVKIIEAPPDASEALPERASKPKAQKPKAAEPERSIRVVTIALSDGSVYKKRNLSHPQLAKWVESLEALC